MNIISRCSLSAVYEFAQLLKRRMTDDQPIISTSIWIWEMFTANAKKIWQDSSCDNYENMIIFLKTKIDEAL